MAEGEGAGQSQPTARSPRCGRDGWVAARGRSLSGEFTLPGDKSVSHRAVMLAALADGDSRIDGFLEGEDTRATAAIFAAMGVGIEAASPSCRIVRGVGIDGLRAPAGPLDCGNSGTAMRLLAGLLAGQRFDSVLLGDASLSQRPMQRVAAPVRAMGAVIDSDDGGRPPLRITGRQALRGLDYATPVASAQVKSALLLAGLYAEGETRVSEPRPTRDYTERMLSAFGWPVDFAPGMARLEGGHRLHARDIEVPVDFSSAAFFIVAATLVPGSSLVLRSVGVDPRRTGLIDALRAMGADIRELGRRDGICGPVADIAVRHAPLRGIDLPVALVADMIDEFPVFAVAAACASGRTRITGAAELRVKESDRISAMASGLQALGVDVRESPDGMLVQGGPMRGGAVDSLGDHRIAMAFAVAAQRAEGEVTIGDVANVATSFPGFETLAQAAGFGLRRA
ncbi:3-phosphoshikimate 1-carboxyvinyltransferase [Luteimonas sp. A649]